MNTPIVSAPSLLEAARRIVTKYEVGFAPARPPRSVPDEALVARAYIKACEALEKTRLHLGRVSLGLTLPADDVQRTIRKIVDEQIAMIDDALPCSSEPVSTGSIAPTISRPAPKPEK